MSSNTQAQLTSTLPPLLENASAVRLFGDQTVAMVAVRVANASQLYKQGAAAPDPGPQPGPQLGELLPVCRFFFRFVAIYGVAKVGSRSVVRHLQCRAKLVKSAYNNYHDLNVGAASKPYPLNDRHLSLVFVGRGAA